MPLRICRQCTVSNLPFKPLVRFYTSSDGGRLSPHPSGNVPVQIRLSNCLHIADSLCTADGSRRTLLTFSVCRKTSIVRYQKWGWGRSPKQGEGGSPTLSPFPGGRGLGIGIENSHYFIKKQTFSTS